MNNDIFYFFYSLAHQSALMNNVIVFFAVYFPYIVIALAVIFLLFHHDVLTSNNPIVRLKKKWEEILAAFFAGGLAWLLAFMFKLFFHTPRPFDVLSGVTALFSPADYSFPSGHATFFFALAGALFFSHKKAGYVFFAFAILISIARVAAGVHFPIDILGGFFLGFSISFIIKSLSKKQ
ncbi:MAG TPA: phosphatase PAP2 family protein [Candidatus Paceibacterota bacterium]|jgi:undecaprenyl-diphosphatase|nr:phosphatase PAP2 family protein [Candidatus Paceibacterota bacterium]